MAFIGGRFASMLQSEEGENAGKRPSASYARSRPLACPTPHDLPAAIQKIRVELKILPSQTLTHLTYILQLCRPTKLPALFLYLLYIIARCDSPDTLYLWSSAINGLSSQGFRPHSRNHEGVCIDRGGCDCKGALTTLPHQNPLSKLHCILCRY